jgi:dTDP-3-amino-3,4,6-trideoxy-alpha-D-glucose transaminase
MPSDIPLGDLRREYARIRPEIDAAIGRVLQRGWFILGEEAEAFEAEWAAYCGVAQAVGVGNGTDAIQLILRAAGIGPGDEVIVPSLTAAFSALAVSMVGATPVFADIDAERYTLDPAAFEAAITPRTAAVMPVHLYGCPADMAAIVQIARRHNLFVLEDAAQAHGARYQGRRIGGLGDAAAFSFYPSKNLGAYGDAGAVVTDDAELAGKIRMLRHGGQRGTYEHELAGTNSRLDEMQAAILRAKLPHLDRWTGQRRALASCYGTGLRDAGGLARPTAPAEVEHVYHLYVVRTPLRDTLRDYLAGTGVQTGIHYPKGVHLQAAYAGLGYKEGDCPNAESAASQILSLPIFPQLTATEVEQIIRFVRIFFAMR